MLIRVIRFLASRGLPFRGENLIIGSAKNGNYLGILELLSEIDPFLEEHLKLWKSWKREPIVFIGKHLFYSISVDSTPDISHTDQLTFTGTFEDVSLWNVSLSSPHLFSWCKESSRHCCGFP